MTTNNEQMTLEQALNWLNADERVEYSGCRKVAQVLLAATQPTAREVDEAAEREAFEAADLVILGSRYAHFDTWMAAKRHAASVGVQQPASAQAQSQSDALFAAIAHGDEQHRAWLKNALDQWFAAQRPATGKHGDPVAWLMVNESASGMKSVYLEPPPKGSTIYRDEVDLFPLYLAPPPATSREVPEDRPETAWLIEYFPHRKEPNKQPRWWSGVSWNACDDVAWTENANNAIKFASMIEAGVVAASLTRHNAWEVRKVGLHMHRSLYGEFRPTEHQWFAAAPAAPKEGA